MYQRMFTDFPPGAAADVKSRAEANLVENFGNAALTDPSNLGSWQILTAFSSHALSAMREAIGMPAQVHFACRRGDLERPNWWQVLFDHGAFNTLYEVQDDSQCTADSRWASTTLDSLTHTLKCTPALRGSRFNLTGAVSSCAVLANSSPYIRALPINVTIQKVLPNGDYDENTSRPTYVDFYNLTLIELYKAVTEGTEFPTTVMDGREDVVLTKMIMNAVMDHKQ